jgi:hypothetical protein
VVVDIYIVMSIVKFVLIFPSGIELDKFEHWVHLIFVNLRCTPAVVHILVST